MENIKGMDYLLRDMPIMQPPLTGMKHFHAPGGRTFANFHDRAEAYWQHAMMLVNGGFEIDYVNKD